MSTRNRTSVLPPAKISSTTTKKFELPALPLDNFGSLTDGTDIPPPEREPTPPPAPESIPLPASSSTSQVGDGNDVANGRKPSQISIAGTDGTRPGTPNGEGMLSPVMSPTSPNRPPSSMKRFLSRKSMNADYNHSSHSQSQRNTSMSTTKASDLPYSGSSRPESSLSFVSSGGTKTKKKRSWWQKLMGAKEEDETKGSNGTPLHRKRTSTLLEMNEPKQPPRKKGPPPPKLPELRGVSRGKEDGGFGGDDMFSNIK